MNYNNSHIKRRIVAVDYFELLDGFPDTEFGYPKAIVKISLIAMSLS
ncbi:MAG: hypothetical protein JWM28_383 [Chitinophagaceae bacterium]|nr:hypothetical protein [Chitinophagaceae bacterium]